MHANGIIIEFQFNVPLWAQSCTQELDRNGIQRRAPPRCDLNDRRRNSSCDSLSRLSIVVCSKKFPRNSRRAKNNYREQPWPGSQKYFLLAFVNPLVGSTFTEINYSDQTIYRLNCIFVALSRASVLQLEWKRVKGGGMSWKAHVMTIKLQQTCEQGQQTWFVKI